MRPAAAISGAWPAATPVRHAFHASGWRAPAPRAWFVTASWSSPSGPFHGATGTAAARDRRTEGRPLRASSPHTRHPPNSPPPPRGPQPPPGPPPPARGGGGPGDRGAPAPEPAPAAGPSAGPPAAAGGAGAGSGHG